MMHTRISDLPDLDDVERDRNSNYVTNGYATQGHISSESGLDRDERERVGKIIRKTHMSPIQAGMVREGYATYDAYGGSQPPQQPPPQMVEQMEAIPVDPLSYRCIDIVGHTSACPICSKFYNNDRTVYISIIIILIIICLLMLKKILNV